MAVPPADAFAPIRRLGGSNGLFHAVELWRIRGLLDDVLARRLDPLRLHFLGLDTELVERELLRSQDQDRPGPHAEHMLRDLGIVASRPV